MQASHAEVWQTAERRKALSVAQKMLTRDLDKEFIKEATGLTDLDILHLEDDLTESE
jgi:hypothetical protein